MTLNLPDAETMERLAQEYAKIKRIGTPQRVGAFSVDEAAPISPPPDRPSPNSNRAAPAENESQAANGAPEGNGTPAALPTNTVREGGMSAPVLLALFALMSGQGQQQGLPFGRFSTAQTQRQSTFVFQNGNDQNVFPRARVSRDWTADRRR